MEKEGFVTRLYKWYMRKKPYSTILLIIVFIVIIVLIIFQLYWMVGGIFIIIWVYSQGGKVKFPSGKIVYDIGDKFYKLELDDKIKEIKKFTSDLIENGKFSKGYILNYKALKKIMNSKIPARLRYHHDISYNNNKNKINAIIKNKKEYEESEINFIMGRLPQTIIKTYVAINTLDKKIVTKLFNYYLKRIKK